MIVDELAVRVELDAAQLASRRRSGGERRGRGRRRR